MTLHIADHREGFGKGLTWVARENDSQDVTGIAFGVLKLAQGEVYEEVPERESAWLLMHGTAEVQVGDAVITMQRHSIFDQQPFCVHTCAGEGVKIRCSEDSEFTLYQTHNPEHFASRVYRPEDIDCEQRGKGQVGNTCWREVRTIFGLGNTCPSSALVLGEVITFPGCWSSYPPHHHRQPEIYHYRFTEPQGYGHAELGEEVYKVKQYDTVKILHPNDHAQCAAPGYGMYYSWVIRHLPDDRYHHPEFTWEHNWIMSSGAKYWQPKNKA